MRLKQNSHLRRCCQNGTIKFQVGIEEVRWWYSFYHQPEGYVCSEVIQMKQNLVLECNWHSETQTRDSFATFGELVLS